MEKEMDGSTLHHHMNEVLTNELYWVEAESLFQSPTTTTNTTTTTTATTTTSTTTTTPIHHTNQQSLTVSTEANTDCTKGTETNTSSDHTIIHHTEDDDDNDDLCLHDIFTDPDPYETFTFQWDIMQPPNSNTMNSTNNDAVRKNIDNIDQHEYLNNNDDKNTTTIKAKIVASGMKAENGQLLHSTGLTVWRASNILADWLVHMYNHQIHQQQQLVKEIIHDTIPMDDHITFHSNTTILELGCGLGIPGMLCHYYLNTGLTILSDGDIHTLHNVRNNMKVQQEEYHKINSSSRSNGPSRDVPTSRICCQQLVWGNQQHIHDVLEIVRQYHYDTSNIINDNDTRIGFDVILGSDIIYVNHVVEPLFETVRQLLLHHSSSSTTMPFQQNENDIEQFESNTYQSKRNGVFILAFARRNVSIDYVLQVATEKGFTCNIPSNDRILMTAESSSLSTSTTNPAIEGVYIFRLQQ